MHGLRSDVVMAKGAFGHGSVASTFFRRNGERWSLLRVVLVGSVLALSATGLAVLSFPASSWAAPPPTVSSFAATPSALDAAGGLVDLSAQVTHATSCRFSSDPPIAGLPHKKACSIGLVEMNVTVPANNLLVPVTYKFKLSVSVGTTAVKAKIKLTVADNPDSSVTAIGAGGQSNCALFAGGAVDCWGDNTYGELGNGTNIGPDTPVTVSGITGATAIASGDFHNCALLTGGTVDCWGANFNGALGNGTSGGPDCGGSCSATPVPVSGITGATAIAAGGSDSCALLTGGTVDCWGANFYGSLGNGTSGGPDCQGNCYDTPVPVSGITGATAIAVGGFQTCALLTGGAVDCWGNNTDGELGTGSATGPDLCGPSVGQHPCSTTPVAVSGLTGATAIAAGGYHNCALLAGGTIDCWGSNAVGELGNGTNVGPDCGGSCSATPVPVAGLSGATTITAGQYYSCALSTGATVDCWGYNNDGEFGNGTTTDSSTPVPVNGLTGPTAVTAGGYHNCAFLAGGTVDCWGSNNNGQLVGNKTIRKSLTPIVIAGL